MSKHIYVGNLPFTTNWGELKDLVREVAGVNAERTDVAINQMGKSRGFGIVVVSTATEAQRVIDSLKGYSFQGRSLEVREDRNAPAGPGSGTSFAGNARSGSINGDSTQGDAGNVNLTHRALYVGNLPYSVQWQDLKDLLRGAGNIVRADIPTDTQGRSKGYGIVVMSSLEDARKAVSMFAGYEWNGRRLEVREDRGVSDESAIGALGSGGGSGSISGSGVGRTGGPPADRFGGSQGQGQQGNQLYVGNLPYSFSWQDVKDLLRQAGTVIRADVGTDGVRSKGYGTVVMATPADAQKAIQMLNGAEVQGRVLEVRYDRLGGGARPSGPIGGMGGGSSAGPRSVDPDAAATGTGTAVFITNLPFTTRWQDLKDIFRPHNLVATHADVIVDSAGRSKGLGTIRFNTQEDAERAVQIASGLQIGGRLISARLDRFL